MGTGVEAVLVTELIAETGAIIAVEAAASSFAWGSVLSSVALNMASSVVMSAFKDTPSSSSRSTGAFQQDAAGRQQMIRSSVAERKVVYGPCKISGPIVYGTTTGADNSNMWLVIALAGHEVEGIDDIYFNDDVIPNRYFVSQEVVIEKYAHLAWVMKHTGASGQVVDGSLNAADPTNWDATKTGDGVAYIVVELTWDRDVYSSGLPNISALVRGKKLYDPRTGLTVYSANWALAVRDYLTNSDYGMGCASTEINDASFIAAANICDERVLMSTTTSDSLYNTFTTSESKVTSGFKELLQTGDGVRFTGTLPPELSTGTTYYWIRLESGIGYLATSAANAFAGSAIAITDSVGTGYMTYYDQARYEVSGVISTSETPMNVLKALLPAGAGTLVWRQGEWYIYAGAYRSTSGTLTVSDLRDSIEVMAQPSRRELYNQVRGVYSDPNSNYQPIDFPIRSNSTYETQDGGLIARDVPLPFTNNTYRAQRIANIFLEKSRQGMVVKFPAKPNAIKYAIWDTVSLTIAELGWSAKDFTVTGWALNPDCSIDLTLQEEASSSYTWAGSDSVVVDQAPDTNLVSPANVDAITGIALASGTDQLFVAADGTVHSRIRVSWTAVNNVFVTSGGQIEIQYAVAAGSPQDWLRAPDTPGSATYAYIAPVEDAVQYVVRIRAVSSLGVASAWAQTTHTVIGKTEAPSDVTGFSALQTGNVVLFACNTVSDADLDSIEVAYGDADNGNVVDAIPVANILRGQTATTAALPPGTWNIFARAKDTSGNYSANAQLVQITVTADGYTTITSATYSPEWNGTLTNMVKHWTGVLTPDSQSLASALGWEVFDEFVPNAYADCYFTVSEIDKGIDGTARVYSDIISVLGPGETGIAAPAFEIDTRLSTGSYDGFDRWTIGNENFRYFKSRIHVDTAVGKPVISGYSVFVDGASRIERGVLTVGGGGSGAQSFANTFHSAPAMQVTPVGSGDVSASYASVTTTGFTGYFKSGGVAAAGDISWQATGV